MVDMIKIMPPVTEQILLKKGSSPTVISEINSQLSLNVEVTGRHDSSTGFHQRTLSGGGVVTATYVIDPERWEEPDVWIRCRLVRRIDDHSVEIAVVSMDEFNEVDLDQQTYRLTSRLKVGVTTSDADGTRHEPLPVAS